MSGHDGRLPVAADARPLGLVVLAHGVAVLTVLGLAMQLILVPDVLDSLIPWGLSITVFTLTALTVGWLIAWKRPRMALGWIILAIAFLFGLQGLTLGLADLLERAAPLPASWLFSYGGGNSQYSWIPPIGLLFTQVPLRFPTGGLPSRRWRWFSWYTIAALALCSGLIATSDVPVSPGVPNPFTVDWGPATAFVAVLSFAVVIPAFIGSIVSLFVRHRHANAVERAQLRWVFWAVATVSGSLMFSWLEGAIFGDETSGGVSGFVANAIEFLTGFGYSLIPLAILFAVLRYGLYSIDRIISRTFSYAAVTLSVILIYAGVVILTSLLLPDMKSVGIALATLITAAVFLPLLRVVRRGVDRRFNREQYNAQKVLEAFGERIRNGADPHTASRDLVAAIEQTLQPGVIGVWTTQGSR